MAISMAAALIGSALVGGATSIIGGKKASKATVQAANTAAASADKADATNRYIFDTTRADYAPYREIGTAALDQLASMYGVRRPTSGGVSTMYTAGNGFGTLPTNIDLTTGAPIATGGGNFIEAAPASSVGAANDYGGFRTSPGYQFRVDEAMKAIERSAAARGGLRSGATMDAIQRRVQGVADDEYEHFADRLAQLAGVGQAGAAGSAAAGAQYTAGARDTARMTGDAALAAGNARASGYVNTANAVNNTVSNVAQAFMYNRGFGGGGGNPSSGWGTPGLY